MVSYTRRDDPCIKTIRAGPGLQYRARSKGVCAAKSALRAAAELNDRKVPLHLAACIRRGPGRRHQPAEGMAQGTLAPQGSSPGTVPGTGGETMRIGKTLLWINCCLFVGFGLGFVLAPTVLATLVTGSAPATPSAITDMRATYGGMALGLAYIFRLCAGREEYVRLGLRGILAVMVALAAARLLGIVLDGAPNIFIFILLLAEVAMVVASLAALAKVRP